MSFDDQHRRRFPELLAAYADGELDEVRRAEVEAWLSAHPSAHQLLESQLRLSRHNRRLWQAAAPAAPGECGWAEVFGRVQDVLDSPAAPAASAPSRPRRWRLLASALSTAAAATIALYLGTSGGDSGPAVVADGSSIEPLIIASAADVDVISMDDRDAANLVVGIPPLTGKVVLAAADDVKLKNVQKDADGMMPKVQMNDAGLAPMIIAPIAGR
jgi:anti-sigma factor RsiW